MYKMTAIDGYLYNTDLSVVRFIQYNQIKSSEEGLSYPVDDGRDERPRLRASQRTPPTFPSQHGDGMGRST